MQQQWMQAIEKRKKVGYKKFFLFLFFLHKPMLQAHQCQKCVFGRGGNWALLHTFTERGEEQSLSSVQSSLLCVFFFESQGYNIYILLYFFLLISHIAPFVLFRTHMFSLSQLVWMKLYICVFHDHSQVLTT